MNLHDVEGVGEWLNKIIPVNVMFSNEMEQPRRECVIIPFGMAIRLRMVGRTCQIRHTELRADKGKPLHCKLRTVVCEDAVGIRYGITHDS